MIRQIVSVGNDLIFWEFKRLTRTWRIGMLADIFEIFIVKLLGIFVREFFLWPKIKVIHLHTGFKFFAVDWKKTLPNGLFLLDLALFHHGIFLWLASFHTFSLFIGRILLCFLKLKKRYTIWMRIWLMKLWLILENVLKRSQTKKVIHDWTVTSFKTWDLVCGFKSQSSLCLSFELNGPLLRMFKKLQIF